MVADKLDSAGNILEPPRTADPGGMRFAYKRDTPPLLEIDEHPKNNLPKLRLPVGQYENILS